MARTMSESAAPMPLAARAARIKAGFFSGSPQSSRWPSQRYTASVTRWSPAAAASMAPAANRWPFRRAESARSLRDASGSDRSIRLAEICVEREGVASPSNMVPARASAFAGSKRRAQAIVISTMPSSLSQDRPSASAQSSHASTWTSGQPSGARTLTMRFARSISRTGRSIEAAWEANGKRMRRSRIWPVRQVSGLFA
ncbi:MAG: hypothetical protein RJB12_207 [Pseudomonadota bacterium]